MTAPPHQRAPRLEYVKPEDLINDPEYRLDQQHFKLLLRAEKGQIDVGFTRLEVDRISSGYYARDNNKSVHISNIKVDRSDIIIKIIKEGQRPAIDVYWNALNPKEHKWVCPDDENILTAYQKLGIKLVPCRILKPKDEPLNEATIWASNNGGIPTYKRALAPHISSFKSILGEKNPPPPNISLKILQEKCEETRALLKEFHIEASDGTHYHQMIHAVIARHERSIDTIDYLISIGRNEHAAAIVRMAYEAFLNFYIDWLAPWFFGPRLQLFSALRNMPNRQPASISNPDTTALKALGGFEKLFDVVAQKANISPLGETFHRVVYPPLSSIMHQTYGNIEPEASSFNTSPNTDEKALQNALIRWLDLITTALIVRSRNEIGAV